MSYGWNYPAGVARPSYTEIELECVNPGCSQYGMVEGLAATKELGSAYLRNEDEQFCPECGWEHVDPADKPWPLVDTPDGMVLVDTRDDEPFMASDRSPVGDQQLADVHHQLRKRELQRRCEHRESLLARNQLT